MRHGRFEESMSTLLRDYGESISFDWRLYRHDIRGSIAHARAILNAGFLNQAEFASIEKGLNAIGEEIAAGKFVFSVDLEDIHMNIEKELTNRIGDAGAKLHTARSRNDQVATDLRLYLRDEIASLQSGVRALQTALIVLASANESVLLPGYTHLQRAQPVPLAHHLLAYVEMLNRDHGRLGDVALRMDELPLGSGALAASTLLLDREAIAKELGFSRVTQNSLDGVSDRDFALELLSALAIVGMHLSRLSEDVVLWTTTEFGFARLSDRHSTGSSLMPQKKNPDVPELVRGKSGRVFGHLMGLLTMIKGLPLAYNKDFQEDKEALFDGVRTCRDCLEAMAILFEEGLEFRPQRLEAAVASDFSNATDVADYLVAKGIPFREAYQLVGGLVKTCLAEQVLLKDLPLERWQQLHPGFEADIYAAIAPRQVVAARRSEGGTAFDQVERQLQRIRTRLATGAQKG